MKNRKKFLAHRRRHPNDLHIAKPRPACDPYVSVRVDDPVVQLNEYFSWVKKLKITIANIIGYVISKFR